jgi:hypothetical protein
VLGFGGADRGSYSPRDGMRRILHADLPEAGKPRILYNSCLAGKSKTPGAGFAQPVLMSNINPNCDGSHCRHGYKEVRNYPSAPSSADNSLEAGSGADALYLCLPCFANENMHRYLDFRASEIQTQSAPANAGTKHLAGCSDQPERDYNKAGASGALWRRVGFLPTGRASC